MTSRRFLAVVALLVFGLALPSSAWNLWRDEFGLFWSNGPKRIWTLEKTSKYLLSFRYIPRHFDGVLIGPSFSDGLMDTRRLPGRIYNASMDAANASELQPVALNAIERGRLRVLILCLSPYLTKDHGMKGPQINPKEYWGSLFSWLPFEVEIARLQIQSHRVHDAFADSTWGMGNMIERKTYTWRDFEQTERADAPDLRLDPLAYAALESILSAARAHGVRVLAYYYPYSRWSLETLQQSGAWRRYQQQMAALFRPGDDVWDMTAPAYDRLRGDAACYTDGHLSGAGAAWVLADIAGHLAAAGEGRSSLAELNRPACLGRPDAGSGFDVRATATAGADPSPG